MSSDTLIRNFDSDWVVVAVIVVSLQASFVSAVFGAVTVSVVVLMMLCATSVRYSSWRIKIYYRDLPANLLNSDTPLTK